MSKWLTEEVELGTTRRYWLLIFAIWALSISVRAAISLIQVFT